MKRLLFAAALAAVTAPALATDVGVSISVGQPGFYGRIDLGNAPQPQVVYAEPVVVRPVPVGVVYEPVYLHVPPGHQKNWRRYCGRYDACGRPVYFVKDSWYNNVYVPHYREQHGGGRGGYDGGRGGRDGGRGGYYEGGGKQERGHGRGHRGD